MKPGSKTLVTLLAGIIIGASAGPMLLAQAADVPAGQPTGLLRLFAEVFSRVRSDYVEVVDDQKAIGGCLAGMVSAIDADSAYLDAAALAELRAPPAGVAGIGLELARGEGALMVVAPVDGGPAQRAGLATGDLLLAIDGQPTRGMDLATAMRRLRGKPDSEVSVTVARTGTDDRRLSLRRQLLTVASVRATEVEPGIGYLRLTQFSEGTPAAFTSELARLYRDRPLRGLVLDLRNNGGGLLTGGIALAAAFLPPEATIATTAGRSKEASRRYRAVADDYAGRPGVDVLAGVPPAVRETPLVVLVNGGSAAASEIVAAALQDHRRATVVGSRTFGRASIQTLWPLAENGALKLTTARWTSPDGRQIHGQGITPDLAVDDDGNPQRWGTAADPALASALALLRDGSRR